MRNKNQSVEDARLRRQDKEMAKEFKGLKEYNHMIAKQGSGYDRNTRYFIEYNGLAVCGLKNIYKFSEAKNTTKYDSMVIDISEIKLTKQFKHMVYIIRKVREYNEIAKNSYLDHVMLLKYDGDTLELILRYWNDPLLDINHESVITDVSAYKLDIMAFSYSEATRELSKVPHKIKVMATKL